MMFSYDIMSIPSYVCKSNEANWVNSNIDEITKIVSYLGRGLHLYAFQIIIAGEDNLIEIIYF